MYKIKSAILIVIFLTTAQIEASNKLEPCIDWERAWKHAKAGKTVKVTFRVSTEKALGFSISVMDYDRKVTIHKVYGAFFGSKDFSAMFVIDEELKKLKNPPRNVYFLVKPESLIEGLPPEKDEMYLHSIMVELITP